MERRQFDMSIEAERFQGMIAQGIGREVRMMYAEQELKTDVGERLDRSESHYAYQMRDGKLYADGITEPFEESIERGIIQNWDGSRERAELGTFRFVQDYMACSDTPDGAIVFNPSPGDGLNYQKNYLDVYKKVGNQVHAVRYFSDLTNQQYREKILEINPAYSQAIPENPTDVDFFLSPVIVPKHLEFNPDGLADFILGSKKGLLETVFQEDWNNPEIVPLKLSIINTLVDNPWALLELEKKQKALYVGVRKIKDKEFVPTFNCLQMKIQYLSEQKETLGGGGCGSGACSTGSRSSVLESMGPRDEKGALNFSCPSCGTENTRPYGGYVYRCKNEKCKDPEAVLPAVLRNKSRIN